MALQENNIEIIKETTTNIKSLFTKVKQIEIRCFLSNENDILDSYLEFHAGAGGTESQDCCRKIRIGVEVETGLRLQKNVGKFL